MAPDFQWKPEPVAWQPKWVSKESNTGYDSHREPNHKSRHGHRHRRHKQACRRGRRERGAVKGLDPVPDPVY